MRNGSDLFLLRRDLLMESSDSELDAQFLPCVPAVPRPIDPRLPDRYDPVLVPLIKRRSQTT